MSDESRPPAGQSQREPYLLAPVECRHRDQSRRMILRAAESVAPGRAAVLGAGACEEIPLAELAERFSQVTLNDFVAEPIEQALGALALPPASWAKLNVQVADLTGITEPTLDRIEAALAVAGDVASAIDAMGQVLDEAEAGPWPIAGRFDLVVASCVIGQLHVALTHEAAARFEARFPGRAESLRQSDAWEVALDRIARRMEDTFVADLALLVASGGLVYLSESAQMCYIELTADRRWKTEGTWRMLRTKDLADYVRDRFAIVERDRWEWVVAAPAGVGETGRLFDVQALLLRPGG